MDGNAEEATSVYIGMDSNLVVLQVFDQCGVPAESFTSLCSIGVEKSLSRLSTPSEPCERFSRTRLSSR